MDVIEIDAASNRGINEMRELRENVRFRPARDRYKVFIVDEAHQITSEAFNALLKTLEEPPEWVVFILCTTESHKIPVDHRVALPAVQFPLGRFRGAGRAHGVDHRSRKASRPMPKCCSVLAQAGEGSVRDSLSALDQAIACCGTKLEAAEVRDAARHVFARVAGPGDAGALATAIRTRCSTWWRSWKPTAAACSISRASWLAISAICWW